MHRPEILAPCGNKEAFEAALRAGADAVYLAGSSFGARAYAGNFDRDVLLSTLERAHLFGVKVYLTVNTLFKNEELGALKDFLTPLYEAGLDAVLVQDFGAADYIKQHFPELPIHMSTQMNITAEAGARMAYEYGAERVVMNREITLSELEAIKKNVPIEVEAFVHGAMCFSYSGRCLLSSLAGGRSGNRGRCAQPCRKLYTHEKNSGYIMSMKDMCTLTDIPALIEAGVDSLKIEGRMKNEYYVAAVVAAYKELVDDYMEGCFSYEKAEALRDRLKEVFSRGEFTEGYLRLSSRESSEIAKAGLISAGKQGHAGVKLGTVSRVGKGNIVISLDRDLNVGDELLIVHKGSEIKLTSNVAAGAKNRSGSSGGTVTLNCPKTRELISGIEVRRLKNARITAETEELLNTRPKLMVEAEVCLKTGEPVTLRYNNVTVTGPVAEPASKNPVTDETLKKAAGRLGDTDFVLGDFKAVNDGQSFIPVSVLNDMRREAVEKLISSITENYRRTAHSDDSEVVDHQTDNPEEAAPLTENSEETSPAGLSENNLFISVSTKEQLDAVLGTGVSQDAVIMLDLGLGLSPEEAEDIISKSSETGKKTMGIMLPYNHSFMEGSPYLKLLDLADIIYLRNIDDYYVIRSRMTAGERDVEASRGKQIILGASLYAYNDGAVKHFTGEMGRVLFESPYELNKQELAGIDYAGGAGYIKHIYGRLPAMITAALATKKRTLEIKDDKFNYFFIIPNDKLYYNVVLNGLPECLFAEKNQFERCLIAFTNETASEVRKVIKEYEAGSEKPDFKYTHGNFYRGIE